MCCGLAFVHSYGKNDIFAEYDRAAKMLLGDLENTKNNFESNENALDAYPRSIAHAGHTGFRRIQNPGDGDCLIYSLLHSVAGISHCDCSQSTRDALRRAVRYEPEGATFCTARIKQCREDVIDVAIELTEKSNCI